LLLIHQLAAQLSQQRRQTGQNYKNRFGHDKRTGHAARRIFGYITKWIPMFLKLNGKIKWIFNQRQSGCHLNHWLSRSGENYSRISLAIQVTTSNDKTTPTLIFDEVDSGIGVGCWNCRAKTTQFKPQSKSDVVIIYRKSRHRRITISTLKRTIKTISLLPVSDCWMWRTHWRNCQKLAGYYHSNTLRMPKKCYFNPLPANSWKYCIRNLKTMNRFPANGKTIRRLNLLPHKTGTSAIDLNL